MYLGIDLGTSGVKAVLTDEAGQVIRSAAAPLIVSRPKPRWSEQDPTTWWTATLNAVTELRAGGDLTALKSIGLSGQMHGATLLSDAGLPVRPAILWNDGRAADECRELERLVPNARTITGNRIMPGFTAPKLLWVRNHEPDVFAATKMVLLPKDYLRYRLTGELATDMSDAAGTMWLDVGKRDWNDSLLNATGLTTSHMPRLFEGPAPTGRLTAEVAGLLGCDRVPVVAGAGDNAAGALGVGITRPGQAMLSVGTSGTYFVVTDAFSQNPGQAVHSFCHALPGTWHVMSVILSAASCLTWLAHICDKTIEDLLLEAESKASHPKKLFFLPYLAGERTPHDDPFATGAFFGLTHAVERGDLAYAVIEGVSFALCQGADALHAATLAPSAISIIGGGARSAYWTQLLCDALGIKLNYCRGSEVGPALGAAHLARASELPADQIRSAFPSPIIEREHQPNTAAHHRLIERREAFSDLYTRGIPESSDDENSEPAY